MNILRLLLISGVLYLGISPDILAQDPQQSSNFVVIGAFAKLDNAVKLTNAANQDNFQAQYAINTQRRLYYVFILNTEDRKKASSFLLKIRVETKYKDAWIYSGKLGEESQPVVLATKNLPIIQEKSVEPIFVAPVIEELPNKDSVVISPIILIDSSNFTKPVEAVVEKPVGKPFYFRLVNAETGKEVTGEVQVVESKASQYMGFKGNEIVYLSSPKNATGVYQVNIQAPGYKPAKIALNYKDPTAVSSGTGDKEETILTFELIRSKKGDYIDFNNVRFFRNSTILEPTSQNELDELADLLKENTKYKIMIHGHCNGDNSRDIITLGTSTTIFQLEPKSNGKETATAKRLTELRAEAVKGYLVDLGIEDRRISTKGEGGKMMIYSLTSTLANYNDRIEIEVLKGR